MSALVDILALVTLGSIISLLIALLFLRREKFFAKAHLYFIAFAAGTLIGTALFDLIPEAIEHAEEAGINGDLPFIFIAVGLAVFFMLEKFLHWYHDHHGHGPAGQVTRTAAPLISFGDGLHNFIDGSLIAATTITDPALGLLTAIAVFFHEIPQEVGDFSILIFSGLSRAQAILFNLGSAGAAYLGAIATYIAAERIESFTVPLIAITAGSFIFISLSELVPELVHKQNSGIKTVLLAITFVIAIFIVRYLSSILGLGHGH